MNTIARRVARLERQDAANQTDGCTYEEFCRRWWRSDQQEFRDFARDPQNWMLRHMIPQFEAEDRERNR